MRPLPPLRVRCHLHCRHRRLHTAGGESESCRPALTMICWRWGLPRTGRKFIPSLATSSTSRRGSELFSTSWNTPLRPTEEDSPLLLVLPGLPHLPRRGTQPQLLPEDRTSNHSLNSTVLPGPCSLYPGFYSTYTTSRRGRYHLRATPWTLTVLPVLLGPTLPPLLPVEELTAS